MNCGRTTKPAPAWNLRCWRNSIRWKMRSSRWASPHGPWSRSKQMTRSRQPHTLRRRTKRCRGCRSGHQTKTSRSASSESAWYRWIGEVVRFEMKTGFATSSALGPHLSQTTSRWSATRLMAIRAFQGSEPKQQHGSSRSTATSNSFRAEILRENRERALLFKNLATLRTDAPLFENVDQLKWRGPTEDFASVAQKLDDARLATRIGNLTA